MSNFGTIVPMVVLLCTIHSSTRVCILSECAGTGTPSHLAIVYATRIFLYHLSSTLDDYGSSHTDSVQMKQSKGFQILPCKS